MYIQTHKHTYIYTHLCISVPSALLHVHITQISRLCTLDFFSFPPQVSPLSHQLSYAQFASSCACKYFWFALKIRTLFL